MNPGKVLLWIGLGLAMLAGARGGVAQLGDGAGKESPAPAAITLVKTPADKAEDGELMARRPASGHAVELGYREFGTAKVHEVSAPHTYILRFGAPTTLTSIAAKGDFALKGGSCVEGRPYPAGALCTVEMAFTPHAPGYRAGKLVVSHTASAAPFVVPAGGEAVGPSVSFIPGQELNTVTAFVTPTSQSTYLKTVDELAIDGGDNLYIPDAKAGVVYYLDSSGVVQILGTSAGSSFSSPTGVATDPFGDVFVAESGNSVVGVVYPDGNWEHVITAGATSTTGCTYTAQCPVTAGGSKQYSFNATPAYLASDQAGDVFMDGYYGTFYTGELGYKNADPPSSDYGFWYLQTPWASETDSGIFAVDANDNLYMADNVTAGQANARGVSTECYIYGQNAEYSNAQPGGRYWVVAGTRTCGYTGDGGRAVGAEISSEQGGFAFDVAGNLYFTDTGNNVVRRVDATTGLIHTIAGTGTGTGNAATSNAATEIPLVTPFAIAVDSYGDVYVTESGPGNNLGPFALVKEIEAGSGELDFPATGVGVPSAAQIVQVSNTGNAPLVFTNSGFYYSNPRDYSIDPITTTCNFTAGLAAGASCQIGVIFTPEGAGGRFAALVIDDNAADGVNKVYLQGTGNTQGVPTLSPKNGLSFGSIPELSTSAPQTVTLKNAGQEPFVWNLYTLTSGFEVTGGTCGASGKLAAGASCTFVVAFDPSNIVLYSGTFSFTAIEPTGNVTVSIPLNGSGIAGATLSPEPMIFPAQIVGTKGYQNLALTNITSSPITVSAPVITGSTSPFTLLTPAGVTSIQPGGNQVFEIIFQPSAAGTFSELLSVTTSRGVVTATITGTATAAATSTGLTPATLNFPATIAGGSSGETLLLSNNSGKPMQYDNVVTTGGSGFAVSTTCGSVPSGSSCPFSVGFYPSAPGTVTETVTVQATLGTAGNYTAGVYTATLTGTGLAAYTLTPSLTFGSEVVGSTSAAEVLVMKNNGVQPLIVQGIPTIAGTAVDFAIGTGTNACGNTLAIAASCNFYITFSPKSAGSLNNTFTVFTDEGKASASLTGTGTAAAAKPKVTLAAKANPAPEGEPVGLTSSVTGIAIKSATAGRTILSEPTGKVELREGSAVLATASLVDGGVSFSLEDLAPGTHILTAWYLGDGTHAASESSPVTQVVSGRGAITE